MIRRLALAFLGAAAVGIALLLALPAPDRSAGRIEGDARSADELHSREAGRAEGARAVGAPAAKRILFGDLHVHTTFSFDALVYSLPLFAGEGAHPPADACDFARHCAALDFFSLNDHAESLTPARWRETIESARQCSARAGDPQDPDLVAYVGWEWTQVGDTPETHFGHRNVILPGLEDAEIPARPVTALPPGVTSRARGIAAARALERLGRGWLGGWGEFLWLSAQLARLPDCPGGVASPDLPADCRENAETPAELFEKLAQWKVDALVIPHGLAWGVHAPPGARLDFALRDGNHDPAVERLVEVFSGHGNSEELRDAPEPVATCPEPTGDLLACCWRAGEIVRARCGDLPAAQCEARVEEARRLVLASPREPHRVLPDTQPEDWLDCDQCRDCFKPALSLRPGMSAQYGLALSGERDREGRPRRLRWGFIASTDTHKARPGTGYKQVQRTRTTDARGYASEAWEARLHSFAVGEAEDPGRARAVAEEPRGLRGLFDVERAASFMYPGGIVGVHAAGRDRRTLFEAIRRREVYGTSGPRMLLWFDLLNAPGGAAPMGSEVALAVSPLFEVRAVGDFVQKPGCPPAAERGLAPERLQGLCGGECYHPSDERHRIVAIEVVRIRPQQAKGEPVAPLVEDPWRRFECPPDPSGCAVRFEDPEFPGSGRDAVYYVRALQEATPAVNGANLRTRFDARGNAVAVTPCHAGWRTPESEDCLAPVKERAWSSPIFVDRP